MGNLRGPTEPLELEALLAHGAWIRPLARRLLADDASADDILQEACLAFLRRLPRSVEASGAWLGRVVRNLVSRSRQAQVRRERRERRAARPERIAVPAHQVLEQAEMHGLLVEEVLRLDEPYRSTVLLRFFGEQTPAEIARHAEVPLETVRTRLRRAIGQLRLRLDRRSGGRETWTCGLLALAGGAGALCSAPAGAAATTTSTTSTTTTTHLSSTVLGGTIMAQKTALTVGLITIITLAGGFGLGRFTASRDAGDVQARLDLRRAREAETGLMKDVTQLREENEKLAAARATLEEKRSELERETARLGEKVGELEAKSAADQPGEKRSPRLAFRDTGDIEEYLRDANWREMAQAAVEMTSRLKEMHQSDAEPGQEQQIEFRLEEQKLIAITLRTENKLPTHVNDGNGGFTHPIIHWNLLAERLEMAGLPLSDRQVERMSRLGVEYDVAWERQDAGYGIDTLLFEKVVDELELKRTFNEQLLSLLTRKQRQVIVDPALHDTYPYDVFSPLLLLAGKVEPLVRKTRDEVRKSLQKELGERYGLSEEQLRQAGGPFDAWLARVEPLLATPLASLATHRVYFVTGAEAIVAGRAQASLMQDLLALLPPDSAARSKLLGSNRLYLPRLGEKK